MKMTYLLCGLLASCLFNVSCKTLQVSDLRPIGSNNQKISLLIPQIDLASVENSYTKGSSVSQGVGVATTSNYITVGSFAGTSISFPDKRIQDVVTLFERDVQNNICASTSEPQGNIGLKITFSNTKQGGAGYIVPAILTVGIAWACGMPINTVTQELEVQVEIRNKAGQLISKYEAVGKSKVNVAAYHGYTKGDAPYMVQASVGRKANIEAYNMAMTEIKASIERDYDKIQKGLQTN
jgi:hypothetical protein